MCLFARHVTTMWLEYQKKGKKREREKYLRKLNSKTTQKFPKFSENNKPTDSRRSINTKWTQRKPHHIIIKLLKTGNKEKRYRKKGQKKKKWPQTHQTQWSRTDEMKGEKLVKLEHSENILQKLSNEDFSSNKSERMFCQQVFTKRNVNENFQTQWNDTRWKTRWQKKKEKDPTKIVNIQVNIKTCLFHFFQKNLKNNWLFKTKICCGV